MTTYNGQLAVEEVPGVGSVYHLCSQLFRRIQPKVPDLLAALERVAACIGRPDSETVLVEGPACPSPFQPSRRARLGVPEPPAVLAEVVAHPGQPVIEGVLAERPVLHRFYPQPFRQVRPTVPEPPTALEEVVARSSQPVVSLPALGLPSAAGPYRQALLVA